MIFENILYIPKLKTNILSLGKLDSQGCDIRLRDGFLTLYDGQGRLLTKTDGYYVAYKPITLPCILFVFIEMKFIHCHSCVMFVMKSMSMCND